MLSCAISALNGIVMLQHWLLCPARFSVRAASGGKMRIALLVSMLFLAIAPVSGVTPAWAVGPRMDDNGRP
jgi:hypothetical protein